MPSCPRVPQSGGRYVGVIPFTHLFVTLSHCNTCLMSHDYSITQLAPRLILCHILEVSLMPLFSHIIPSPALSHNRCMHCPYSPEPYGIAIWSCAHTSCSPLTSVDCANFHSHNSPSAYLLGSHVHL